MLSLSDQIQDTRTPEEDYLSTPGLLTTGLSINLPPGDDQGSGGNPNDDYDLSSNDDGDEEEQARKAG